MSELMWSGQRRQWGDGIIELKKAVTRLVDGVPTRGWAFAASCPTAVDWMSVSDLERETVRAPSERSGAAPPNTTSEPRRHSHYFRSVAGLQEIDIYRVLELFGVTDQALGHAIKKLVVPGMRGGGKTGRKDIEEAVDTLRRRLEMMDEDAAVEKAVPAAPAAAVPEGFTVWDGSSEDGPSLPSGSLVDLMFRDGDVHGYCNPAVYTWRHRTRPDDIVAYRACVAAPRDHSELRKTWAPGQRWQVSADGGQSWDDLSSTEPRWNMRLDYRRHPDDVPAVPSPSPTCAPVPDDYWTPWDGRHKAGPVRPADATYEIKLRNGVEMRCGIGADVRWTHNSNDGDIVAYRKVPRV